MNEYIYIHLTRIRQFLPFDLQEQTVSDRNERKYQKLAKISNKLHRNIRHAKKFTWKA